VKLLLIGGVVGLVIGAGLAILYFSLAYFLRSTQERWTLSKKMKVRRKYRRYKRDRRSESGHCSKNLTGCFRRIAGTLAAITGSFGSFKPYLRLFPMRLLHELR
jgi:hypothetical protein